MYPSLLWKYFNKVIVRLLSCQVLKIKLVEISMERFMASAIRDAGAIVGRGAEDWRRALGKIMTS